MKKLILYPVFVLGLCTEHAAQAQAGALVNLIGLGVRVGAQAALKPKLTPEQRAAQQAAEKEAASKQGVAELDAAGPAVPKELVLHRTPADKLPKKSAEQITSLETQLDACHAAMLATPTGVVCSPEQRTAIQNAAVSVARAQPGWDLHPYQQEMAFYLAEDARRQQAASPATPAK
ncbi:hypothetical protein [Hymenobacter sp. BRD67]|uniref:hypothetical protein n=1 Tax=Hymenobacter sp. BRD67 TaxID=2675877 RepID=UPI001566518D|nr:hypothetical protein [Hymenobacter sp. BRD67]QKG52948.1 hypothetical protein GKZ67_10420 [Hymenobacter sp. BRD67]